VVQVGPTKILENSHFQDIKMSTIISHIALVVREPERTAHLLQMLFNAKALPPKKEGRRPPETMVSVGDIWFVLVKGEPSSSRTDDHIAFTVQETELPALAEKLSALGIESQMSRAGAVVKPLYFVDYDNHLFELHAGQLI
jgi:fosfomycin resistance protein FosX